MKIVADKNVPFLEGVFEPYADVVYLDGKEITRVSIRLWRFCRKQHYPG